MSISFVYKLRPGKQAQTKLNDEWDRVRWEWNQYVTDGKRPDRMNIVERSQELTKARQKFGWFRAGSSVLQQQIKRKYDKAIKDAFKVKGRGLPKTKSRKHDKMSLPYVKTGFRIKYPEGRNPVLVLAGNIQLPIVYSRELPSIPSSVVVYQDSCDDYWAAFTVNDETIKSLPETNSSIGIDWGVKETATTTDDSFDFLYQHVRKDLQKRKAKYQRMMNRRHIKGAKQQSKGYLRAKKQAAHIQRKARRVNKETQRLWAQKIVKNFDHIAVEDFKPKFMQNNKKLARKSSDAAIGQCKQILIETASKYGRKLILVDPYMTTQTCSKCGAITKHHLELNDRIFHCEYCNHTQQRDKNSADLILSLAGFNQADYNNIRRKEAPDVMPSAINSLL